MKQSYTDIQAYPVSGLLWLTDRLMMFPYLRNLARKKTSSLELCLGGGESPWQSEEDRQQIEQDIRNGATFLTNHRDIIMDAAWLSYLLRTRYGIRPYMGIGNNLLRLHWVEFLVRFNRCFVVVRDGSPKEVLANAKHLSDYIGYLRDKQKSIWLAQREGRAKDGNDRTQLSVLKMLTLGSNDFLAAVRRLNICPVSISYEYDPCDYLKAREMQCRRDNPAWHKAKGEDERSMKTGITGWKGRVVHRLTPSLNHWLDRHPELVQMSRNEQIAAVAKRIDYQIHSAYEIYNRGHEFEQYLQSRLDLIDLPNKDDEFLRDCLRMMYLNPVRNHEIALQTAP